MELPRFLHVKDEFRTSRNRPNHVTKPPIVYNSISRHSARPSAGYSCPYPPFPYGNGPHKRTNSGYRTAPTSPNPLVFAAIAKIKTQCQRRRQPTTWVSFSRPTPPIATKSATLLLVELPGTKISVTSSFISQTNAINRSVSHTRSGHADVDARSRRPETRRVQIFGLLLYHNNNAEAVGMECSAAALKSSSYLPSFTLTDFISQQSPTLGPYIVDDCDGDQNGQNIKYALDGLQESAMSQSVQTTVTISSRV